jgi:DNA-binding transcriptional ArsR family regulator
MSIRSDDSGTEPSSCDVFIVDPAAVERATAAMPDDRGLKALCDIFNALADPTRLRILRALATEPLCVCDLAAVTGVSPSAVSHQLRVLRDRNLVAYDRDGKRAIYRLADEHVATLLAEGFDHAHEDGLP